MIGQVGKDDYIVKEHIKDYIEISKYLQKECEKYNLPFIDVSQNREHILEDLSNKLIEK